MNRGLLLVTLLTTIFIVPTTTAPIQPQNVTTRSVETTTTEYTEEYIFPKETESNSSVTENQIVVETVDVQHNTNQSNQEEETAFVDLEKANADSNEGENKIETKVSTGDAPEITHIVGPLKEPESTLQPVEAVASIDDEDSFYVPDDEDASDAPPVKEEVEVETTTVKITTTTKAAETSIKSPSTSTTTAKPYIERALESSNDTIIDDYGMQKMINITDGKDPAMEWDNPKHNANLYPKTFSENLNHYTSYFVREHPTISFIAIFILFVVLFSLLVFTCRQCCSKRRSRYRRPTPSPVADLYNTSSCSHEFTKPMILPNRTNVTMQLISSDVESDTL